MSAQQYTFQNLGQLSHTAGQIPCIYDVDNDVYRPVRNTDYAAGANKYTSRGRLKTSNTETIFFNTFQYGKETDIWDEFVTGGASGIHNPNINRVDMSVSQVSGSEIIRQTFNAQRYIPSRTSNLTFAVQFDLPVSGIRRRIGLFDYENGFYFEDGGNGEYYCVLRSSTSGSINETRVPRSQWNGDKLDGTGPSEIVADPTKQQIVNFEYEWYGGGEVTTSYLINGQLRRIHTFYAANVIDGPWCKTPFLPIRCELKNTTGGQATGRYHLHQGSNSLTSEGSTELFGSPISLSLPVDGKTIPKDNYYPLISIRLKSTDLKGIVLPKRFQVSNAERNADIFYKLIKNANLVGANWQNHPDVNGFTQYDFSATGALGTGTAIQGQVLDNGIVIYAAGGSSIELEPLIYYQIGRSGLNNTGLSPYSETYTIAVAHNAAGNRNINACMTWIEQR